MRIRDWSSDGCSSDLTFAPMASTLMLALASAFILSITFVPAMVALLVTDKVSETEVRSIRWFKEKYQPALTRAVARPMPFILGGAGVFAAAVLLFGTLGQEFMPQLDEKDRKSTRLNSSH